MSGKKQKAKTVRNAVEPKSQRCVLVATYKKSPDQLKWIGKRHVYNYPLSKDEPENHGWDKIKEIWLYSGKTDKRHIFESEYIGIKSRKDFLAEHPDYPKDNRKHGDSYAVFKVAQKEFSAKENTDVIVRVDDFHMRTPTIAKVIKEYQSGAGVGGLLDCLPVDLRSSADELAHGRGAPLQLRFWDMPGMEVLCPPVPFPPPKDPKFTFIDLFAGVGGFRLAMQSVGGKCVFSSEWDAAAQDTYEANYGERPFGDITKQETKNAIPKHFDVLCAGFPCQAFSNAGLKKGFSDTRGTLFFDILQIVKARKPKVIFLENVRNLMGHDGGKTFKVIRESLEAEGYSFKAALIDASPLVPQKRIRCYMVCVRGGGPFEFPVIKGPEKKLKTILEDNPSDEYTISDNLWAGHQRRTKVNIERGTGFTAFTADIEKPAHTLVARYYKDGKECLIPQRGRNPRMLTPKECARLQGFPGGFVLPKAKSKAYKQMGNSVAVPVLEKIAKSILDQLLVGRRI